MRSFYVLMPQLIPHTRCKTTVTDVSRYMAFARDSNPHKPRRKCCLPTSSLSWAQCFGRQWVSKVRGDSFCLRISEFGVTDIVGVLDTGDTSRDEASVNIAASRWAVSWCH